nr:expressed protein [Hymenolepis microstoma]
MAFSLALMEQNAILQTRSQINDHALIPRTVLHPYRYGFGELSSYFEELKCLKDVHKIPINEEHGLESARVNMTVNSLLKKLYEPFTVTEFYKAMKAIFLNCQSTAMGPIYFDFMTPFVLTSAAPFVCIPNVPKDHGYLSTTNDIAYFLASTEEFKSIETELNDPDERFLWKNIYRDISIDIQESNKLYYNTEPDTVSYDTYWTVINKVLKRLFKSGIICKNIFEQLLRAINDLKFYAKDLRASNAEMSPSSLSFYFSDGEERNRIIKKESTLQNQMSGNREFFDPVINPLCLVPLREMMKIPFSSNLNYFDFDFKDQVLTFYEHISKRTVKIVTRSVMNGYRLSVSALLTYLSHMHSLIPLNFEESKVFYLGLPSTLIIASLNIPKVDEHRIAAIPTFIDEGDGIQRVSVRVLNPICEEFANLNRFQTTMALARDSERFSAAVARFRKDDFVQSHSEYSMSFPCYWRIIIYAVTLCTTRGTEARFLFMAILRSVQIVMRMLYKPLRREG